MRQTSSRLTLAAIAALLLVACGGGGGGSSSSSSSSGGTANTPPVANAGANQTVNSGVTVTLNGTASSDADGTIASYAWTQTAGTAVTLTSATTSQPTFPAPTVAVSTALTFSLLVTDNRGSVSPAATVTVTVNPAGGGNGTIVGQITFARVPFKPRTAGNPNAGLDYANPVQQPSRGVLVRALVSGTQTELARTTTDALGNYSLTVTANTMVTIEVVARMVRDTTQALPRWNMRVQNGATTTLGVVIDSPYTYTDGASVNSSAGTARNIAIPAGSNAAGTAPSARPSAAFAILDTLYQGIQTIIGVAPTTDFPTLIVDWGSQTVGTFFTTGPQQIALFADLNTDTDEFDQHVIAHEFGHYIEFNFSRANNIGGSHGVGDKLDPRVAFGEGFGYAFAAIVLNDPLARDSFVDDSPFPNCGVAHCSAGFNVETNPPSAPVFRTNYGCWCSESSVWSILWDLFDTAPDTNDTVALGFQPMWDVLTGAQKTTPAFTTIFSYITALKAQNTASAAAIDTLVAAQNVTSATMDAYGATETHSPIEVPSDAALPVYRVATVGGPAVVLRTVDDAESPSNADDGFNKIGDRRFVRFTLATTRNVTITASSSNLNNPDVDFIVYRSGVRILAATGPPAPSETATLTNALPGDYLVDVYDCANGCSIPEGTSGDYNLTVTIN